MILNKIVLVVVPARGGSKGILRKNLREVCGMPLVAIVGKVVSTLKGIDRVVVSTDDEDIASVAEHSGISAPFRSPPEISGDRIGDDTVLKHALLVMERIDETQYDIVVMLQPTSPLRKAQHILDTINMLIENNFDAVWTVSETDSKAHPLKQLTVSRTGELDYYDPVGGEIIARQQLKTVYHRNGIAYAVTRNCILNQKNIKGDNTGALVIEGQHVSIDTEWDLSLVEFILSNGNLKSPI